MRSWRSCEHKGDLSVYPGKRLEQGQVWGSRELLAQSQAGFVTRPQTGPTAPGQGGHPEDVAGFYFGRIYC